MPTPLDPRTNDNPSTYFVQDRKNQKELTRLTIQDQAVKAVMGGVLPEQTDPAVFRRVLDVGCGPGGWIIDTAQTYPEMSLVGIDISQRMIEYACTQAKAHQVRDRVEFRVMDALRPLEFPVDCFDLVNVRFGVSYLRTWDWPKFLSELLRVARPGGVVRVTDSEIVLQSNSSALTRLCEMSQCALYRSGHLFTEEPTGLIDHLVRLLDQYGYEQVQTKTYTMEYRAGTPEGEACYEDVMLFFQTGRPFILKWGCATKDYDALYRQALSEMRQPDFLATGNLLTAWGSKPKPRS
ncbi:MAG TPA: methyltransferase domain-containing protein [Ktedonobacteraceae bacterium]|nr:methyltransferase domain-containing protein [Ktedonobacteraceae bacterium]